MAMPKDGEKRDSTLPVEEALSTNVPLKVKMWGALLRFFGWLQYRADGTVNRKLGKYLDRVVPVSSKPINGITSKDVVIDSINNVWLRLFSPATPTPKVDGKDTDEVEASSSYRKIPIIIYYHGGGFIGQSADSSGYDPYCRMIAKKCNMIVLSINYRLAPEFPFPAAYDDCYKAFEWLRSPESKHELPAAADVSQCILIGDSAGGNIAHFMGCRAAENDISPVKLLGMVELMPFFGGEELTPMEIHLKPPLLTMADCEWAWRAFLPGENRDHPNINVFGPNSPDISGLSLPPILVVTGTLDILHDRHVAYVKKLEDMGKDVTLLNYPGAPHAFYILPLGESTHEAMEAVYKFVRSLVAL